MRPINEKPIGICPACKETVFLADDAVWTCPADLSEKNAYKESAHPEITEEMREKSGIFSNCGEDFGFYCYDRMPLHGHCYEKGNY